MGKIKILALPAFNKDNIIYWIYPLIMLDRLFFFLNIDIYLQWPTRLLIAYVAYKCYKQPKNKLSNLSLLWLFVFYNLLSVVLYFLHDVPIQCYILDVLYYIFPISFVLIAVSNRVDDEKFYYSLMISFAFCIILGIYMYFFTPNWYQSNLVRIKLIKSGLEYSEEHLLDVTRMGSFMASAYATSHFSIFLMIISASFLIGRKHYNTLFVGICFLAGFLGALLCQQRIAMAYCVVVLLFFIVKGFISGVKGMKSFIIIMFVLLIMSSALTLLPQARFADVSEMITGRIEVLSYQEAMEGGREEQHQAVLSNIKSYLLGAGMGSGGTMARVLGYPGVSDGNYHKIFYETGIVGFLIFVILMIKTLFLLYKKKAQVELLMVIFILIAMVGSNSLCVSPLIIFPFWYAVGVAWRPRNITKKVDFLNK